jgi:hypothetical protein
LRSLAIKILNAAIEAKSAIVLLDSQIALADRLIDQMVYRLYGLTHDEIKIVEQPA